MMAELPRIAVGTTQAKTDGTALLWALMELLASAGLRVQNFVSRAYVPPHDGATAITGQAPRPLDTWLMCAELCRELLVRGSRASDLALIEGSFAAPPKCPEGAAGGSLATLCEWLDLPCLAIVDARQLTGCQLPACPPRVDGLLIDRVRDAAEACRLQTQLEALWNVPVVGWLGTATELRGQLDALPPGARPSVTLCRALGQELARHVQLERILRLATRRPLPCCQLESRGWSGCHLANPDKPLRVAVACDEAFGGYFADTLEMLETRGANLCDFSPLHDDRLPPQTDLVYIGGGHPERFAAALSGNDCLMLAMKGHLCSGRRIYAECGGLAYLCHEITLPDGQRWPMVGALGATAEYHHSDAAPHAAEVTLVTDTWLGQSPLRCRGYVNPDWTLCEHDAPECCVAEAGHESDIVHRHQAIGSRMYVDFAAHKDLLDRFFEPHCQRPLTDNLANQRHGAWL